MSAKDSSNTHEVIGDTVPRHEHQASRTERRADIPRWADAFPYVNGGLFSGSMDVPRFSRIARSYLLHIGNLDWKKINPDIFGSMIQAVAEDEERGALGMHYTSVPNILKVLNPLFLDDLRAQLEEAGDNARMLLNLRKRMAKIRVFDPACGSGNFLVIAYKEMRAIEAEINSRRGEADRRTEIPLTNFRGIELRDFPAEIARLALIIAEYQCDVLYRGQKEALRGVPAAGRAELDHLRQCAAARLAEHLPADGNRREATGRRPVSHATGSGADRLRERGRRNLHLRKSALSQGSTWQTDDRKRDLEAVFSERAQELEIARLRCGMVYEGRRLRARSACVCCICRDKLNLPRGAGAHPLAAYFCERAMKSRSLILHSNGRILRATMLA